MLFHSYSFIFIHFPLLWFLHFILEKFFRQTRLYFLLISSAVFYALGQLPHFFILIGSISLNYCIGCLISNPKFLNQRLKFYLIGIAFNIYLLAYFKYHDFFVHIINDLFQKNLPYANLLLPLAISFYTFQQIAFLTDVYRQKITSFNGKSYFSFILFFPQLIAGPIVRYQQLAPQLNRPYRFHWPELVGGIGMFTLGLSKKVLIADQLLPYNISIEKALIAEHGVSFIDAWTNLFIYSFRLYFDFSAYSDMAIGLALMLGIYLPINFHSPYKSSSLQEFWRRWHITLMNFFRDYIYIPLGGSRQSPIKQGLLIGGIFFIGGLWHGAGFQFILWGLCHGALLILEKYSPIKIPFKPVKVTLVFLGVSTLWVFFQASDWDSTKAYFNILFTLNGSESFQFRYLSHYSTAIISLAIIIPLVFLAPNSQQIIGYKMLIKTKETHQMSEKFLRSKMVLVGACFTVAIIFLVQPYEFIYFRF